MKRFLAMVCIGAILTGTVVCAAGTFPDLPEGHWAYGAVDKMVNDGRVNGFPDGTFQPDELVTRWQFAKMAGGDPDAMTNPDREATRDEAVLYLWERAGKPSGIAPGAITQKSENPQAVAWAYSTGIMQGDDGWNLRLDSTLSRAEAACLIVRAEQDLTANVGVKDTVKPILLQRVWEAMQTGIAYEPDRTLTNGELARLAMQIASGTQIPNYVGLEKSPEFEGEYALDVTLAAQECWGTECATAEFAAEEVTMQNAVAALSFYTMKQAVATLHIGSGAYDDTTLKTPKGKLALSFANHNGIYLTAENKLDADRKATVKDVACVLMQLDEIVGLNRTYGTSGHSVLLKQEYPWPSNAADYPCILEEVPTSVYEKPLMSEATPTESYTYARDFVYAFEDFLNQVAGQVPASVKVQWTMYPSLIAKSGNRAVIRAKLNIIDNPDGLSLNQIFTKNSLEQTYTGSNFWVDIDTGERLGDIMIDADAYTVLCAFTGKE